MKQHPQWVPLELTEVDRRGAQLVVSRQCVRVPQVQLDLEWGRDCSGGRWRDRKQSADCLKDYGGAA